MANAQPLIRVCVTVDTVAPPVPRVSLNNFTSSTLNSKGNNNIECQNLNSLVKIYFWCKCLHNLSCVYSCIINLNDHYCSMFLLQLSVVLVVPMEEPVLAQMFASVRMVILVQIVPYVSFIFSLCRYYVVDSCSYHKNVNLVGFFLQLSAIPLV